MPGELVMADRYDAAGNDPEAEPVIVATIGSCLRLTLDDGEMLAFDRAATAVILAALRPDSPVEVAA